MRRLAAQPAPTAAGNVTTAARSSAGSRSNFIPAVARIVARRLNRTHNVAARPFSALRGRQQCYAGSENRTHGQTGHEVQ